MIRKDRTYSGGGGVAILIDKDLEFEYVNCENFLELEIIIIKIKLKKQLIHFASWYLAPNAQLPEPKFFTDLNKFSNLVLCGDLNCKSNFGTKENQIPMAKNLRIY